MEKSRYDTAVQRTANVFDNYANDRINLGEAALQTLGHSAALPMGYISDMFPDIDMPEIRYKGRPIQEVFAESDAGQWMANNPRAMDNIMAVMNILEVAGVGKVGKTALNTIAGNTETLVRGGMLGDAVDIVRRATGGNVGDSSVAKAAASGKGEGINFYGGGGGTQVVSMLGQAMNTVPNTLKELLNPQSVANTRVLGLPEAKRREIARGAEDAEKTAQSIMQQQGKNISKDIPPTLNPLTAGVYYEKGIDVKDFGNLQDALGTRYLDPKGQMPDGDVVQRYARHVQAKLTDENRFVDPLQRSFNAPATEVNIKNVGNAKDELVGTTGSASPLAKLFSGRGGTAEGYLDKYNEIAESLGRPLKRALDRRDTVELMQIAASFDKNTVRKHFGKDVKSTQIINALTKARLKQRMTEANGGKVTRKTKLGDFEERVLTFWENPPRSFTRAKIKDDLGNVVSDMDFNKITGGEGKLYGQAVLLSKQKEIASSNNFVAYDPAMGKVYSGIVDKHDIGGLNPVGGHSMGIATPLEQFRPSGSAFGKRSRGRPKPLAQRTDISTTDRKQAAMLELEDYLQSQGAAVPIQRGAKGGLLETPRQYTSRVFNAVDAPVTASDYANALMNASGMLAAASDSQN